MLRIINLTRNVGANLFRSSIREDRPKSGTISQSPSQFLFWFNETPGHFTPAPRLHSNLLPVSVNTKGSKDIDHYAEFSEHQDDRRGCHQSPFSYLRAVQCSAILAVSYSILHDKYLSRVIQDSFQHISLESILQSHCPVLSVKHHKSAHAQSTRKDDQVTDGSIEDCLAQLSIQTEKLLTDDVPLSTSDYSSHKSESGSSSLSPFTDEEASLMMVERLVPNNIEHVLSLIDEVRQGDSNAVQQLSILSDDGFHLAQFYLGQIYENGILVTKSKRKALKLYTEAAEGGVAEAKFNLGLMYLKGEVRNKESHTRNEEYGLSLVKEAAQEGISEARQMLGLSPEHFPSSPFNETLTLEQQEELFKKGIIMEENILCDDEDKWFAMDFYKVAAENGHKEAKQRYNRLKEKI